MENIIITKNPAEAQVVTHGGVFHADEVMAVAGDEGLKGL